MAQDGAAGDGDGSCIGAVAQSARAADFENAFADGRLTGVGADAREKLRSSAGLDEGELISVGS